MSAILSGSSIQESSLLLLDAYEHRVQAGRAVEEASLEGLREQLSQTPEFEGRLGATLRVLDLIDTVKNGTTERSNSLEAQEENESTEDTAEDNNVGRVPGQRSESHTSSESEVIESDSSNRNSETAIFVGERHPQQHIDRSSGSSRAVRFKDQVQSFIGEGSPPIQQESPIQQRSASPMNEHSQTVAFIGSDQQESPIQRRPASPMNENSQTVAFIDSDYQVRFKDQTRSVVRQYDAPEACEVPMAVAVLIEEENAPIAPRRRRKHRHRLQASERLSF